MWVSFDCSTTAEINIALGKKLLVPSACHTAHCATKQSEMSSASNRLASSTTIRSLTKRSHTLLSTSIRLTVDPQPSHPSACSLSAMLRATLALSSLEVAHIAHFPCRVFSPQRGDGLHITRSLQARALDNVSMSSTNHPHFRLRSK